VTCDYYYNTSWQCLEIRKDQTAETPNVYKQYAWDLRYIDAPLCRDTDGDADGDCTETDWSAGNVTDEHLYYCQDANFNVTALVRRGDGTVLERYLYDPYGKTTFLAADWSLQENGDTDGIASNYDNEVLYCGYRFDTESGLNHVRHRSYHPTLGRWMQRDPIGYKGGLALYAYIQCRPVLGYDPKGLVWPDPDFVEDHGISRTETYRHSWTDRNTVEEVLKSCNILILIAHQYVVHFEAHFDEVEPCAAIGYLTCWGRLYNWDRDESAGNGSTDRPASGSISNFPDIRGPVGTGEGPRRAGPVGVSESMQEMYDVNGPYLPDEWNAGEGDGKEGWDDMWPDARRAAKEQAKKFCENESCKCMCQTIRVWIRGYGDISWAGDLGKDARGVKVTRNRARRENVLIHEEACR